MKHNRYITAVGMVLMLVALLANPWFLAAVLSPDGEIDSVAIRNLIILTEILLLIPGVFAFTHPRSTVATVAFARRFPRLAATLFGLTAAWVTIVMIIATTEVGLRLITSGKFAKQNPNPVRAKFVAEFFRPDAMLGFRPRPNSQVRYRLHHQHKLVYDVTYTTDEFGKRVSTLAPSATPTQFALFFGGSFTFGEGLHGDETIPVRFANNRPEFRPYNFGFSGYGPQQMPVQLGQQEIINQINESDGIAIYTFINDHINRAIGSMQIVNQGSQDFPYYAVKNGVLTYHGGFALGRPYTTLLYSILGKSHLARALDFTLPLRHTDEHLERTARIIMEGNRMFKDRFPSSEFYVMIFPGSTAGKSIISRLENAGLTVLNYTDLLSDHVDETQALFYADGHPTARACAIVADKLARDVRTRHKN